MHRIKTPLRRRGITWRRRRGFARAYALRGTPNTSPVLCLALLLVVDRAYALRGNRNASTAFHLSRLLLVNPATAWRGVHSPAVCIKIKRPAGALYFSGGDGGI